MWRARRFVLGAALVLFGTGPLGLSFADAPPRAPLPPARIAPPETGPAATTEDLRRRFAHSGRSGWQLVDVGTGEVLDAFEPDRSFAPASVAKLPTALYALDAFGPDQRFVTRLSKTGRISSGVLGGTLYLVGGSDPELDSDGLAELVDELARLGVTRVEGSFVVTASAALQVREIDPDQPGDMPFNPAVSGLNLNFNRVRVRWGRSAGSEGVSVSALAERFDPPIEQVEVRSVGGSVPLFQHSRVEGREVWTFNARALAGTGSRWLPVRAPELYAGDAFRQLARTRGITVPPPVVGALDPAARVIAQRPSRALAPILLDMLRFSTNLTAEVVGAAASQVGTDAQIGSLAQSAALMNGWVAHTGGFSPGDPRIRFVNHSGLSEDSRVSPSRLVGLLRATRGAGIDVWDLLTPYNVATEDDPLGPLLPEVRAKTGTMDRIRGLAGYIETASGRQLAFAIFSNDLAGRAADRRVIAGGWMRSARAFERALIRDWVRRIDESQVSR